MNAKKEKPWVWVGLMPVGVLSPTCSLSGFCMPTLTESKALSACARYGHGFGQPMVVLIAFLFLLPATASLIFLWPVLLWLGRGESNAEAPPRVVQRAANAPVVLGIFTAAVWALVGVVTLLRLVSHAELTPGFMGAFFCPSDPYGLIATTGVYFTVEPCRRQMWPAIFANRPVTGDPGIWRIHCSTTHHVLGHYHFLFR